MHVVPRSAAVETRDDDRTARIETGELLRLENISVRLGGRQILSDVGFAIREGEFAGIIGPNGAGKTTLLRVILGLQPAAGGRVLVDGKSVGYVPQKLLIDPDMPLRARDVVSLGIDGHRLGFGFPSRRRGELVARALEDVGALDYADARVGELSGGEQQRVLIAHALISRPRLLLLDEPLANLDLRSEQEIVALLGKLAAEQAIAVLLSAHDVNPLLNVMDRIIYIANGRVATGATDEVVTSAGLSRLYGRHVDVIRVHDRVLVVAGELAMSSGPVLTALLVGGIVAITSGVIGVFTVIRGQSFAGHSLADVATTGGAGAFLAGVNQFWGFLAVGLTSAALLEGMGAQRRRGRDVATGVLLGGALGVAALFLYLGTLRNSTTGASFTILFGSIFVVAADTVPAVVAAGTVALAATAILARVLLLTAISPDLAAVRGVNVRLVGIGYLMALAVDVSLSAVAIGAVLSTALLIGPAAAGLRVTRSPGRAMAVSAATGLAVTWLGILLAYDSYYWPPRGHGWPVSFFVVALTVAAYLLTYVRKPRRLVPRSPHEGAECSPA
jgi:ABC-type Mn2+/Zn2+ transport system ATPase subunit/ABC-type Mn2+/Zn2+ transport system permease subunit